MILTIEKLLIKNPVERKLQRKWKIFQQHCRKWEIIPKSVLF